MNIIKNDENKLEGKEVLMSSDKRKELLRDNITAFIGHHKGETPGRRLYLISYAAIVDAGDPFKTYNSNFIFTVEKYVNVEMIWREMK